MTTSVSPAGSYFAERVGGGPLSLWEKGRLTAAWVLTAAVLVLAGRLALPTQNGDLATCLAVCPRPVFTWLLVTGVAVLCTAGSALIVPARLCDGPLSAAAVGLATLAWWSEPMSAVITDPGVEGVSGRRALYAAMTAEAAAWTGTLLACWVAGHWVQRFIGVGLGGARGGDRGPLRDHLLLSYPAEGIGRVTPPQQPAWARNPLTGVVVTAAVAWFVIWSFAARSPVAAIERKQVYFAVWAGLFLAGVASVYLTMPRHLLGAYVGVAVAAIGAYALAFVRPVLPESVAPAGSALAWRLPPNPLVRATPMVFVAMGVVGVQCGAWVMRRLVVEMLRQEGQR